jgi:hypothetical protein
VYARVVEEKVGDNVPTDIASAESFASVERFAGKEIKTIPA